MHEQIVKCHTAAGLSPHQMQDPPDCDSFVIGCFRLVQMMLRSAWATRLSDGVHAKYGDIKVA